MLFVRFFYWRTWWRSIADYRADDWLGSSGAIDRESGLVTLLIYPMRINDNMIVFMPFTIQPIEIEGECNFRWSADRIESGLNVCGDVGQFVNT